MQEYSMTIILFVAVDLLKFFIDKKSINLGHEILC